MSCDIANLKRVFKKRFAGSLNLPQLLKWSSPSQWNQLHPALWSWLLILCFWFLTDCWLSATSALAPGSVMKMESLTIKSAMQPFSRTTTVPWLPWPWSNPTLWLQLVTSPAQNQGWGKHLMWCYVWSLRTCLSLEPACSWERIVVTSPSSP